MSTNSEHYDKKLIDEFKLNDQLIHKINNTNDLVDSPQDKDQFLKAFTEVVKNNAWRMYSKEYNLDLVYLDYRDELNEEYFSQYLLGDIEEINEQIYCNWYADTRYQGLIHEIQHALAELNIDYNLIDDDLKQELSAIIEQFDNQDILEELVNRSGNQLLRKTLSPSKTLELWDGPNSEKVHASVYLDGESGPARVEAIINYLIKENIVPEISEKNRDEITTMVNNGPEFLHEGVTLDLLWSGDPKEVALNMTQDSRKVKLRKNESITLLLIDSWNGSGYEATLTDVPVTFEITKESPVFLDHDKAHGYGWDEIAGIVHSAYQSSFEDVAENSTI